MTTQELLEEYQFKDLDEVKLIIKMAFPGLLRRAWVTLYPSSYWIKRALGFCEKYLKTNNIDVMVEWSRGKYKIEEEGK